MNVRSIFKTAAQGFVAAVAMTGLAHAGAVISSGPTGVSLGVNDHGALNFGGVGLVYNPTGNDSTFPGCTCEGWGAGVSSLGFSGYQNTATDGTVNLSLVSFVSTASTAVSVVTIARAGVPTLRVTHDYHPFALSANLYEVNVTIENISGAALGAGATDLRYRRVMDWDIEPTPFNEYVTLQGWPATNLVNTSNNGFDTANPLGSTFSISDGVCAAGDASILNTNFTDCGAADHGALFTFGFDALAAGGSRSFQIYYGGFGSEAAADAARALAGIEVYSYGQCSPPSCSFTAGTVNTFVFGFAGVGGTPPAVPEPASLALLGAGLLAFGGMTALRRRRRA